LPETRDVTTTASWTAGAAGVGDRGVLGGLLEQQPMQHVAEHGYADYNGQHDRAVVTTGRTMPSQ